MIAEGIRGHAGWRRGVQHQLNEPVSRQKADESSWKGGEHDKSPHNHRPLYLHPAASAGAPQCCSFNFKLQLLFSNRSPPTTITTWPDFFFLYSCFFPLCLHCSRYFLSFPLSVHIFLQLPMSCSLLLPPPPPPLCFCDLLCYWVR